MMIWWQQHSGKGVTHRRMDGQTARCTDRQKEVFLELLGRSQKYEAMIDKNEEYI